MYLFTQLRPLAVAASILRAIPNHSTSILTWLLLGLLCSTCAPFESDSSTSAPSAVPSPIEVGGNQARSPSAYDRDQVRQNLQPWVGHYSYDRQDGRDPVGAQIAVHYELEIRQDSCFFASIGYQTYFRELVAVRTAGDSLYLRYHTILDGSNFHDEHPDLGLLYRHGQRTWWVNPPFLEDERTLMVKSEN